jgi:hypothetical protein
MVFPRVDVVPRGEAILMKSDAFLKTNEWFKYCMWDFYPEMLNRASRFERPQLRSSPQAEGKCTFSVSKTLQSRL